MGDISSVGPRDHGTRGTVDSHQIYSASSKDDNSIFILGKLLDYNSMSEGSNTVITPVTWSQET